MYGVDSEQHDRGYARTAEWLEVLDGVWSGDRFSYSGRFYRVEDNVLRPKPLARPRPVLYAGGESEAAKELIARRCDAYLMHGDPPERVAAKVADMAVRRERPRGARRPVGVARPLRGGRPRGPAPGRAAPRPQPPAHPA